MALCFMVLCWAAAWESSLQAVFSLMYKDSSFSLMLTCECAVQKKRYPKWVLCWPQGPPVRGPMILRLSYSNSTGQIHTWRCFPIYLNGFFEMKLNSMNCLSSSSERESAVFTFFSPSFITKEGKQNKTHNLSLCFSWSKQRLFKSNLEVILKNLFLWADIIEAFL